nr:hypothetical protein [Fodinibius sp.]NIV09739.1 hypothetical protein [Fodinibius sp.]NIY23265.1 hypothetical protein [Fodinibius sp.]
MKQLNLVFGLFAFIGLLLVGCENTDDIVKPFLAKGDNPAEQSQVLDEEPLLDEGAVFMMTNDPLNNE